MAEFSLVETQTPVLDVHVFVTRLFGLGKTGGIKRDRGAVEIVPWFPLGQRKEGGCQIRVRSHNVSHLTLGDTGTANDEGNVDVFLEAARLAGLEAMLSDVKPIVGGIDDISVVQNSMFGEALDHSVDDLVHGLKRAKSQSMKLVVGVDILLRLLGKIGYP